MFATLLVALALSAPSPASITPSSISVARGDHAQEIEAAGSDVPRLLELARAWAASGEEEAARSAFARVLALEPANEAAHAGLRHHAYDGRWFETYTSLFEYRRAEDARMLSEKNVVRFRDRWVPPSDLSFLRLGWSRLESGEWASPLTLARLTQEQELATKGWQRQDLTWIPPEEFDDWRAGKWKCGERWLGEAEAELYHAEIATPWRAESEHFVVESTLPRARVEWAKWWADGTHADLERIFGVTPGSVPCALDLLGERRDKPRVLVLRNLEQFNSVAAGDPANGIGTRELEGFSSLHFAYFAENWIDATTQPPAFLGAGVAYWDASNPAADAYGQHSIRHAAAQSFVEAIDPSFAAVAAAPNAGFNVPTQLFWGEKRIPRWLRYGAASYAERFFVDSSVAKDGDPMWARRWALENLRMKGGFGKLERVFAFALTLDDQEASTKLIHEAGLVVAYILDGGDKKVGAAHEAFKAALKEGSSTADAVEALQKALLASENAIEDFAKP